MAKNSASICSHNAEIVDEDIDRTLGLGNDRGTLGAGCIRDNPDDVRISGRLDIGNRAVEFLAVASRNDNASALAGTIA
ncbi:hypothetical protein [Rhizobium bangladeshense]|uniref:hypothetical protein n=1 Tax=Rhizobium bangladeshense TaxID=1138189 RepID=UPI001A98410D|nr:hypothetical protein [Rhizobium bangladeshense]MBX4890178.1 hypothetical protein [Rhizobium bangladeshense]MBX4935156.1 hypothetical protein [Rhizobium bangladeshense]MBY3580521.1 hypothetical protein [Rhizobium bangladeshense]QSY91659.1 hypothetical protein J2J98_24470 [Rhizobium bangladeshense]